MNYYNTLTKQEKIEFTKNNLTKDINEKMFVETVVTSDDKSKHIEYIDAKIKKGLKELKKLGAIKIITEMTAETNENSYGEVTSRLLSLVAVVETPDETITDMILDELISGVESNSDLEVSHAEENSFVIDVEFEYGMMTQYKNEFKNAMKESIKNLF